MPCFPSPSRMIKKLSAYKCLQHKKTQGPKSPTDTTAKIKIDHPLASPLLNGLKSINILSTGSPNYFTIDRAVEMFT